jgi:hypothetical protein
MHYVTRWSASITCRRWADSRGSTSYGTVPEEEIYDLIARSGKIPTYLNLRGSGDYHQARIDATTTNSRAPESAGLLWKRYEEIVKGFTAIRILHMTPSPTLPGGSHPTGY